MIASTQIDLLITDGQIVTPEGIVRGEIAFDGGKIVGIGESLDFSARGSIDARGGYVLPGFIDAHVHFNEPGRTEWEGFATGSSALIAGGGTCFIDMPLNSSPPLLDEASFAAKSRAIEEHSLLDAALWGGLVPGHLASLESLAGLGVIGFKAFMSNSGIDEFPLADPATLLEGMERAAELGLPVAVHAESETMTSELTRQSLLRNAHGIRDYLASRPIEAELEAIALALDLAKRSGCSLHVVHVSSARGLGLIAEARSLGQDVTAETCPHYLLLTEGDVERLGAVAKCAPPLRSPTEQGALWDALKSGQVQTLGSDHSPSPPEMKTGENFFKIWGGISGCQHALPLFFPRRWRVMPWRRSELHNSPRRTSRIGSS